MTGATEAAADAEIEWPLIHKLSRPVTVFGAEVSELKLREPTIADFLKFGVLDDGLTGEKMVEMIAHLSGQTPNDIKALPGTEALRLSAKLMRFFGQAVR